MANTSILAAFEKMWQHVVTALTKKSDVGHIHYDATQSTSGFLSAEDKIQLDNGGVPIVSATSSDGVLYTATLEGVTALTIGMKITIIPSTNSTNVSPKLNLNGLGDKFIRMPVAYNSSATATGAIASWIVKNKPITLEYDGTYFKTISMPRPSALYLHGAVPVENGGTGATTAAAALTNLGITATASELNYVDGVTSNIQTQLNGKADSSHTHDYPVDSVNGKTGAVSLSASDIGAAPASVATTSANGLMSPTDKIRVDSMSGTYSLGDFASKTIADLQAALDTWLNSCVGIANASAKFQGSAWISAWNSGDTTRTISAGGIHTVTNVAPHTTKQYALLRISYYDDKQIVYVHRKGGTWGKIRSVAFVDSSVPTSRKVNNKYLSADITLSASDVGAMAQNPTSIELNSTGALSGFGGFIDFHYNGSTEDYTSRIIEETSGTLLVSGDLKIGGKGNKSVSVDGHTHDDRYYTEDEIDAKLANISSGGSSGIVREFDSGEMSVSTYTTPGALAKIYIVKIVEQTNTTSFRHTTIAIDWRMTPFTLNLNSYFDDNEVLLAVTRNNNSTVTFSVDNSSGFTIDRVIGYY